MSIYTIKITYLTGDSFGSNETTDEVGMSWNDVSKAEKAIKSIKEHYLAYQADESPYYRKPKEFTESDVEGKPWYCKGFSGGWRYTLNVEKDDGTLQQISAFWCGHFEELYEAEIVSVADTNCRFSFR